MPFPCWHSNGATASVPGAGRFVPWSGVVLGVALAPPGVAAPARRPQGRGPSGRHDPNARGRRGSLPDDGRRPTGSRLQRGPKLVAPTARGDSEARVRQVVRKAVIPAAGLGTRFLPATKAQPKEMLPLVDKPAIQYVVEEAVRAGITDILVITGRGKRSLEDHFDRSFELEYYLERAGKLDDLKVVREISDMAAVHYIRPKAPLGLGAAVAMAEPHGAGEPFAVLLGDDIIITGNLLANMIDVYDRYGRSVIAGMEVPRSEIHLYGAISPEFVEDNLARVISIVEKPPTEEAPSNLAAIGRYV